MNEFDKCYFCKCYRECSNLQEAQDYCEFIGLVEEYDPPVFVSETKTTITQ